MKKPKIANLATKHIRIDGGTQTRAEINEGAVADYAEAMKAGIILPAAVVFSDGSNNWLADGFHRFHAANSARVQLLCDIRPGTRRDAKEYAMGANGEHGVRRTNADKKKTVEMAFEDEEWGVRSDRFIAELCHVTAPFVAKIRRESGVNRLHLREGQDGKKYPVSERESAESEQKANELKSPEIDGESEQASDAREADEAEQLRAIEEAQAAPVAEEEHDPFDDSDDMPEDIETARESAQDRRAKEESEEEQERAESEAEDAEIAEEEAETSEPKPETKDPKPLTVEEKIEQLPMLQALSKFGHKGQLFRQQAQLWHTCQNVIKAARAKGSHFRYTKGPVTDALSSVAKLPDPAKWEGCATCKGSMRVGERADPCQSCIGGFTIHEGEGVSADVISTNAAAL